MAHRVSADTDAGIVAGAILQRRMGLYFDLCRRLRRNAGSPCSPRSWSRWPCGLASSCPAHRTHWLSCVLAVGALFALAGNPLFGWFSDRTTSTWGMRRPWLVGGALAGFSIAVDRLCQAPSISWLLVGWCLAQLSFNAVLAPLAALLPDHIPPERRERRRASSASAHHSVRWAGHISSRRSPGT